MRRAAILPQGRGDLSPNCGDSSPPRHDFHATTRTAESHLPNAKPSRLWFWFIAAFCVQAAAWTAWLVIAAHHRVQEIPLIP